MEGVGAHRILRVAVQRGVVAAVLLPRHVEVVGHDVDPVQAARQFLDPSTAAAGVVDVIGIAAGRDGDGVVLVVLLARRIESATQLARQRDEIQLVLWPRAGFARHARHAGFGRIFPVDVDAVKAMAAQQPDRRGDEVSARLGGIGDVGKTIRPIPAADRRHHLELRMPLLQRHQRAQVGAVGRLVAKRQRAVERLLARHHQVHRRLGIAMLAVPADVDKGVQRHGQPAGIDIGGGDGEGVGFPAGIVAHHFRCGGGWRDHRRGKAGQRQRECECVHSSLKGQVAFSSATKSYMSPRK